MAHTKRTARAKQPHGNQSSIPEVFRPTFPTLVLTGVATMISYYVWMRVELATLAGEGIAYQWYAELFYFPARILSALPYAEWLAPALVWYVVISLLFNLEKQIATRGKL